MRWDAGAAPGTRAALQAGGPMRASPGAQVCLRLSRAHAGAGEILLALFVSCRRCMPHACGHAHALCTPRARAGTLARARSHALCGTRRASGTRKPDEGNVHRARAVQARRRSQRLLLSVASRDRRKAIAARRTWRGEGRVVRSLASCLASRAVFHDDLIAPILPDGKAVRCQSSGPASGP